MCLLDRMLAVDPARIVCAAGSHRSPANPLRASGQLSSVHAIEYAAQAMALHRSLLSGDGSPPTRGLLTSVRGVRCGVRRLDDIDAPLRIAATRVSGDGNAVVYRFDVSADGRELVTGRIAAVLDAPSSRP
jgi:predicted hotdog family 3-hydroxylacyl-ACP dehydratase